MQALEKNPAESASMQAQQDEHISLTLRTTVPGIPPELRKNIYPFFTTKSEGSGIGLSLCKQIIRLHDGHLTIQESNPGKTIFHIDMPLIKQTFPDIAFSCLLFINETKYII